MKNPAKHWGWFLLRKVGVYSLLFQLFTRFSPVSSVSQMISGDVSVMAILGALVCILSIFTITDFFVLAYSVSTYANRQEARKEIRLAIERGYSWSSLFKKAKDATFRKNIVNSVSRLFPSLGDVVSSLIARGALSEATRLLTLALDKKKSRERKRHEQAQEEKRAIQALLDEAEQLGCLALIKESLSVSLASAQGKLVKARDIITRAQKLGFEIPKENALVEAEQFIAQKTLETKKTEDITCLLERVSYVQNDQTGEEITSDITRLEGLPFSGRDYRILKRSITDALDAEGV